MMDVEISDGKQILEGGLAGFICPACGAILLAMCQQNRLVVADLSCPLSNEEGYICEATLNVVATTTLMAICRQLGTVKPLKS